MVTIHDRGNQRGYRIATKLMPSLIQLSYEEILNEVKMPTLKERRVRGNLNRDVLLISDDGRTTD